MRYKVVVRETFERVLRIDAASPEEAEELKDPNADIELPDGFPPTKDWYAEVDS